MYLFLHYKCDIRVTLNYYIGKGNSNYVTPDISYSSESVSNGGNGVYNQKWSTGVASPTGYRLREAPSCGSYSNGVFSIITCCISTYISKHQSR